MIKRNSYLTSKAFGIYLGASILTALSSMLGNIVDGVIVSNLINPDAMSAVNLSRPVIQFYYTFYLLFGLGGSLLVAYSMGRDDKRQANHIFTVVISLIVAFSALMAVLGLLFPGMVVGWICGSPEVYPFAYDYIKPVLWGCVAYMGSYFLGTYTTIDGAPRLVSVAMIVDNVCNLCLDLVFIKALDMGVAGSSIASLVGHAVGILVMMSHYRAGRSTFRLVPLGGSSLGSSMAAIAKSGAPFAIASICLTVYMYSANTLIQRYFGASGIYIFSVMLSLLTFYNFFLSGACNTLQSLGALLVGLGDMAGLRMSVNSAFRFMLLSLAVCCGVLWIAPGAVCLMFGCPDALLAECSYATRVYAVAFVLFCGIYLLMVNYKLLNLHALSTFLSFALSLSVIPVMGVIAVFFPGAIWWSNLIAYALVAIAVVVWAELKRRRGQSHVTLLPLADARPSLDFSVPYTDDGLASALESIDGFLKSSGLPERSSLAARLSAEELLKNIIQHNAAKRALSGWFVHKPFIDIRISLAQPGSGESLTLSLHDDGEPFNPAEAPRREGSFGLTLATAFDQRLSYKYMFGQNMTIVKI